MTDLDLLALEERRFGGLQRLYGVQGAAQIRAAHVVVVGIGGVGSWTAEALARSGVARLTLIDMDHIAESNVNRQIHALTSTLGRAKALAMQERIAEIHPACLVDVVDDFVGPDNWPALLPAAPDAARLGSTRTTKPICTPAGRWWAAKAVRVCRCTAVFQRQGAHSWAPWCFRP